MSYKATSVTTLTPEVRQVLATARQERQKVVLVTGVFDVLHQEHITFLHKAKAAGDVLIVGIESDARVRVLKGEDRPVNVENLRAQTLARLNLADAVFILPENFDSEPAYRGLLEAVRPAILAVSSHSPFQHVKERLMAEVGGKVEVVHQHNPVVSTTQILASSTES